MWAQFGKNRQISHWKSRRVPKHISFSVSKFCQFFQNFGDWKIIGQVPYGYSMSIAYNIKKCQIKDLSIFEELGRLKDNPMELNNVDLTSTSL